MIRCPLDEMWSLKRKAIWSMVGAWSSMFANAIFWLIIIASVIF